MVEWLDTCTWTTISRDPGFKPRSFVPYTIYEKLSSVSHGAPTQPAVLRKNFLGRSENVSARSSLKMHEKIKLTMTCDKKRAFTSRRHVHRYGFGECQIQEGSTRSGESAEVNVSDHEYKKIRHKKRKGPVTPIGGGGNKNINMNGMW